VRQAWISREDPLPLIRQCALAGVSRATCYAHQRATLVDEDDAMMLRLIDEEYPRHPRAIALKYLYKSITYFLF
jgi:putative transposase